MDDYQLLYELNEHIQKNVAIENLCSIRHALSKGNSSANFLELLKEDDSLMGMLGTDICSYMNNEAFEKTVIERLDDVFFSRCEEAQESLLIKGAVEKLLEGVPEAESYKEVIDALQVGDVLSTRLAQSKLEKLSKFQKSLWYGMKTVQRSPFSSIKMYVGDGNLIGYGLSESKKYERTNPFVKYSAKVYLRTIQKAIVLRHKGITNPIRKKIQAEANRREGLHYNFEAVVKSLFNRLTGERVFNLMKEGKQITIKEAKKYAEPMICSSIIAVVYKAAGLPIHTNKKNILDVWPTDILLSEDMEPVIKLDKPI